MQCFILYCVNTPRHKKGAPVVLRQDSRDASWVAAGRIHTVVADITKIDYQPLKIDTVDSSVI